MRRAANAAEPARSGSVPVLFRDPWLLAVDKPAGIIVHADGTGSTTLTDIVRSQLKAEGGEDAAQAAAELQPLQRLDRDTTGIVLFSLRKETQPAFDRLIAERGITKRYLALARGIISEDERLIDAPIGRDRHDSRRMRVSRTGKAARTRIHVLTRGNGRTLLLIDLLTGRKHQIRVHLAHIGHPLVGDSLYGQPARSGLMLHAYELAFEHPITGETVRITTPWPKRFPNDPAAIRAASPR